jgi:hypothetical protein
MSIHLGATPIGDWRRGGTTSKVMLGGVQVWPPAGGEAPPESDLWTPADLPGTDWEWYDYGVGGSTIGLNGNRISSVDSLRSGGLRLFMANTGNQPEYQGPQGGLPGRMVTNRDAAWGLQSNPVLTGTLASYSMINLEQVDAAFPAAAALVSYLSGANQSSGITSGDTGHTNNVFFSHWNSPRAAWLIENKRQNGVFNPPGTPFLSAVTVPWRNVWGLPSDVVTIGPQYNPRRIFICGEAGFGGEMLGTLQGSTNIGARLYEQIIWKTAHPSLADLQRVEGYMAWKPGNEGLGLVALLPADHPYKNAPPTR